MKYYSYIFEKEYYKLYVNTLYMKLLKGAVKS